MAGAVADHNGLHQAVGLLKGLHSALQGHKAAQDGAVVELGGGDLPGSGGGALADLLNGAHRDLPLSLVGGGGAGDAHPVAHLKVARHGEGVDAGGGILEIDTVKEGGILVIAGGIRGDHALNGVLHALHTLGLDLSNGGDDNGVKVVDQVLANFIVGVVLLRAGVAHLGLDLEVGHERRAGDHDQPLARQLLGSQHHQAAVAVRHRILGDILAAQAVTVAVLGVGGGVAVDHRGDSGRQRGRGISGGIHRIDGGAAILTEELGVEVVVGVGGIKLHPLHEEVVHIVGGEVEPLRLASVEHIIIGGVVADPQGGAQSLQNLVLLGGHVILSRECIILLIVIRPPRQHQRAAGGVEGGEGTDLRIRIGGVGIPQGVAVPAGGHGEDDGLVLALHVLTGSEQIRAGVELDGAYRIVCGQVAEVAHGIIIVACHILVVVGGVNANVHHLGGILDIQSHIHGVGILRALLLQHH